MSLLKSYTCSKCAGVLMFDSDQEFFDCPFCGTKFDAIDFHQDEIVSQAEESLKEEAYSSAKEKYYALLEKDPSDFEALKGLILCELKTPSLDSLESPTIFDAVDVVSLRNYITRLKKQASISDAAFFNQLLQLIDLSDKLKTYQNSINALYSDTTRETVNQSFVNKEMRKVESEHFNSFLPVAFTVLVGIAFGLTAITNNKFIIPIILGACVIGGIILLIYIEDNHSQHMTYESNPIHDAWEMKEYLEKQYAHYEKTYIKEYEKLIEMDRAAKGRTPKPAVPEETKEERSNIRTDHPETVICSKCAGHLFLDKDKRVYECSSCGVAYGISLFFGMPMEKALNAMNTGHYIEAHKRFENVLMVEPSNFDALLGQILCVGGWSRISDIDPSDIIDEEDWNKIKSLFDDAKLRVSESDMEFFVKLEKLIFMLGRICYNNGLLDAMKMKVETLDSISHVYYMAEQLTTEFGGVSRSRKEILSDIDSLEKDNRQLSYDLLASKRDLIQMKNDCVLVK